MARWQRRARLGFGLFAVAFAGVLWAVSGERRSSSSAPPLTPLDRDAVSEIKGGDVVQIKGAARDIRVAFATQVLYADGGAHYTQFTAMVDDRGGRSFEIRGDQARVAPERQAFDVDGNVVIRTSDGLVAQTPRARFAEADGILHGDGPVSFTRGRVSGSGIGFRYDRSIDRLELLDQARVAVAPEEGQGGLAVSSRTAAYSRAERFMRFEGAMHLERSGQVIDAASATLFLFADRDEPERLELRGGARIAGSPDAGALEIMQARDINVRYRPDGRTLEHVLLVGDGKIQLAGADGSPGQQLDAATFEIQLAPDGTISRLAGEGGVQALMPAAGESSGRTVAAQRLLAVGEPGRGLTQMTFEGAVVYREEGRPGEIRRAAQASALTAVLAVSGAFERAVFGGGVIFEQGDLRGEAGEATYEVSEGRLGLRGPVGGPQPTVKNRRVDLRAETIDVGLSPLRLEAHGRVHAVFAPRRSREAARGRLLNDEESVIVVSDELVFDERTGVGTYTGNARILQQESGHSIRAEMIRVNDSTGAVEASGGVVTVLPLAGGEGHRTSIGRAAEFEFDESARRAVYRRNATLDGAQGTLQAAVIELHLLDGSTELRQLVADGGVRVDLGDRRATGQHLVYHPTDERYVLNGTPVTLVQGCQRSSGRTLTFYRASERVLVDGNQETRVQASGGNCPEGREP